jgi:hypothetical protein
MYLWLNGENTRDFTAEFDYQFQKGGNSGFYFHVGDRAEPVKTGIEVQLYESGSKPKDAKLTDHDAGGVVHAEAEHAVEAGGRRRRARRRDSVTSR